MIHLYDGNNVMRRAMENPMLGLRNLRPMSLRQRYTMARPTDIWVWDGYDHNERRRAIYPQYKANRTPPAEDIYSQIRLWKELLTYSPSAQVEVHGWEADDVISTMARQASQAGLQVTIHTNDMDYAQLEHLPGINLDGVDSKGVPGRWVALYKAMVGDPADNIAGIPGFGPKRWAELEEWWSQIERAIAHGHPGGFVGLPFKPAVAAWLAVPENVRALQDMLTITHFENVPDDEIEGGTKQGQYNPLAAHARMSEFFL
jgi:hypothetical protein